METSVHNRLISFIWSIADDCLRDVYVRGKYRDVILPMVVLRRIDALLEPTKADVLAEAEAQKAEGLYPIPEEFKDLTGYGFYNTSPWTLKKLRQNATNSTQLLLTNFQEYLDGYSDNVKEIAEKFKLRSQVEHMARKDVLLSVLEKFTSPHINLTPHETEDPEGRRLPALSNLGMGYVFEELIRKFNEENNEEAGEHFTPREVIQLMGRLVFGPDVERQELGQFFQIYDPACGSGGMLTESQNFLLDPESPIYQPDLSLTNITLYGKEINDETYAICKSDMMIKGNDPSNIRVGSTLSADEFKGTHFAYMLSNPPYGKSWANEQRYIKDGGEVVDERFRVALQDFFKEEKVEDATPRSSDGQLLFLMEMVSKMRAVEYGGSRIASVHNGSSLFTGDAGGGESNIRRYLIENDLLEAIVQLPNNLFYNTGITTYIWLLSNRKAAHLRGKVLLIDAAQRYGKLRKNLGNKNCELRAEHIEEIVAAHRQFADLPREGEEGLAAQVFDNADFGYYKVTVQRPKRLRSQFTPEALAPLRYDKNLREAMTWAYETYGERVYSEIGQLEKEILGWAEAQGLDLNQKKRRALVSPKTWEKHLKLYELGQRLMQAVGQEVFMDFNAFKAQVESTLKAEKIKLSATEKNAIYAAVSVYDPKAEKVVRKRHKLNPDKQAALCERLGASPEDLPHFGYFPTEKRGEFVEYESDSDLRDSENVPLKETPLAYFRREVLPHVPEAWLDLEKTKIGYEISFNKYFYQHKALRSLAEVSQEILALEKESEGLIQEILGM